MLLLLVKATSLLLSVFVIVNGQGGLFFNFSDIIVITQEAVNTSTCHISYDNINNDGSYFISYSEFDEIDERLFEDRTFASHIITHNNALSLANFSTKVPKFNPYTGQKTGYLHAAHLPLYRSNLSNDNEEYNTYNPSIATGSKSSFVVFDSFHPLTNETYIEFNNLQLSHFESLDKSTNYGYPVITSHSQSAATNDDHYLLAYIINANNIRIKTITMMNGTTLSQHFVDDGSIWDQDDVTINNTRISQWNDTPAWIIGYDVTINDTESEIYANPYWWEVRQGDEDPAIDFENEPVLLSDDSCPRCHKVLQDIVPAELICQNGLFDYDKSYLVIYTVDREMVMDLVDVAYDNGQVTLDRIWTESYYILENSDDDTSNVMVGDIQDSNLITLYHIDDPTDEPSNNTDYYIMSYIDEDNRGVIRSFGISGCTPMGPQINWLGAPQELPSTLDLNPWPAAIGSYLDSSLCMAQSKYNPSSMMLAWFEYGDIDIVIDGKECKNCDDATETKFDEYWLYAVEFSWKISPTLSPTKAPTKDPTRTRNPTMDPTQDPTNQPSVSPTPQPTKKPTAGPTAKPVVEVASPTTSPTRNPTLSPIPTSSPTDVPEIDADASAAFTALTTSPLKSPILVAIAVVLGVLVLLAFLGFIHMKSPSACPCFWPTDDARVGALIVYALQVWDFSSDCNFAWCLYMIWLHVNKENDFIYALMWVSIICLVIPWILNLAYIIIQRWRWSRHSIVNAWIRDYAWLLICLCMFSGGANSSILLCNSRLFGLLQFQMELPRYEYIKSSKWPLFFVTMFENIPQIVVQFSFVAHYSLETDSCNIYADSPDDKQLCTAALQSTAFSSVSSIIAVIFAFGVCLLQCSDPLDDKRFILDIKLDEDEDEAKVRLQLGMRRRISLSVAQAIEMHDSVIAIDAVKFGYNRLKFVMSVTESVKHFNGDKEAVHKRRLAKRRSTFIDKLGSALRNDEDEDLDEIHYDKLLHQLLTAKSNGKLAASMKRGLKLQYMPIVDNIEIPEMNTMPNMDEVVQNLKQNLRDQDEVVIVASGGAKRAKSYDDDQRIHQQPNVNAVPVAIDNNNNKKKSGKKKKKKPHQSMIELQESKPGYAKVASLQSLTTHSNQSEIRQQQSNIMVDNNEFLEEKMSPSRNESGNRLLDDAGSGNNSSNSRDDEVIDDIINDTDKGDALHVVPKVRSLNIEGLNKNDTEDFGGGGGNTGGGGGDVGVTPGDDNDDALSSTDDGAMDVDNIADQDVIDAFREKDEDDVDNMDNSIGADDGQDMDLVQEVNGVTMM